MVIRTSIWGICIFAVWGGHLFAQSSNINETVAGYIGDISYEGTTLTDLLLNQQETTNTRLGLISHYCDTVLHQRKKIGGEYDMSLWEVNHNGYRYDPRQSLFMYVLCVGIDEKNKGKEIAGEPYKYRDYKKEFESISYKGDTPAPKITDLLKEEWTASFDFNKVWGIPEQGALDSGDHPEECNPSSTMQACQFSEFAPLIFNTIMNDYSNLKLATLYGYVFGESEEQITKSIEAFSQSYFGIDPEIDKDNPCNDSGVHYLTEKSLKADKQHCGHPKTYAMVRQTLESAQRLTQNTVLLDAKKLLEEGECNDRTSTTNNLFRCSFMNRGESFATTDMETFHNLLLNEMMYYHLFLSYYSSEISANPLYNPLTMGSFSFSADRNQQEIVQIADEQQFSYQAIDQMRRLMAHVYTTYPVHVGLMAYLEDLLVYRSALLRLWTPTNQLYYTRRNAQSCDAP